MRNIIDYRTLFDNMTEEVHFWKLVRNEDGRIATWRLIDANPPALKTWGMNLEDVVGKTTDEIFGPETTAHYMPVLQKIMTEGVAHSFEDYFPNMDKYFRFTSIPLGEYFITTGVDISAIKKTEELLRIERDLLRSIMNGSRNSHLVYLDREFNYVQVNEAYAATCGYRPAEMIGKNLFILYPNAENEAIFSRVRDTGEPFEVRDKPFSFPDQPERGLTWWDWTLTPVRCPDSQIIGLVFSLVETTGRKRTEQLLRNSEYLLSTAERIAHLGSWEWQIATGIEIWSDEQYRIFGYEPGSIVPSYETFVGALHPEDRDRVLAHIRDVLDSNQLYRVETRILLPDGSVKYVLCQGDVNRDGAGTPIRMVGTVLDVTERHLIEKEMLLAKCAAENAYRAKSEFVATLSHEIRNPMNAIIGLVHLLSLTELSPQQLGYLRNIKIANNALHKLINDVLDLSKIEAAKMEMEQIEFSLFETLDQIASMISVQAREKRLELLITIDPAVPEGLIGDPYRLTQVLMNLLGNAIKFTNCGEVSVTVTVAGLAPKEQQVLLQFAVRDSGVGLLQEQVTNLFQPYNQADRSTTRCFGGTGLGLSISKLLVELMGGAIWAEGAPGQGSTFTFTASFGLSTDFIDVKPEFLDELAGMRVLVVEDSLVTALDLVRQLSKLSFQVTNVVNGQEALSELMLAATEPAKSYRVVILDWRLPDLDGLEVARRIRDELDLADPPAIIMVSAHDCDEIWQRAAAFGIKDILEKPIMTHSLIRSIQEVLGLQNHVPVLGRTRAKISVKNLSRLRGARALVVDDQPINLLVLKEILEHLGFTVICAANGQEAVSILARAEDTLDIVFMDLQMPIMDGFEATRQIRKQWQKGDLPIISLTAHILSGERGLCKKVGMNGHLTKPIDIEELHRCLLRWIKPGNRSGNLPVVNERRQSPYGELPDMLPGLDVASGLGRLHGNTELYRRLVISFSRDRSGIAEEIRQALANGDLKQCKDLAHALVGVAGHIAATGLHAVACDLEAACTRGESELLGQLLTDLEVRLAEVLFTAKFLNEQIPPVTVAPVSGKIDPRAVVSLLKELGELSAQQNLKVWRKVSLLGNLLAGSEYAPFATRLSDTLEILDFAAASRQIEALSLLLGAQFPEIRPD